MNKEASVNARVDERLKRDATKVLDKVDVSMTAAIRMFLRQVVLHKGIPFDVRIPNKETQKAIRELRAGKGERYTGSTEDAFKEMIRTAK